MNCFLSFTEKWLFKLSAEHSLNMQSVCVLEESFISCTVSAQNENKMGKCVLREMKAHKFDFGVIAAHILSLGTLYFNENQTYHFPLIYSSLAYLPYSFYKGNIMSEGCVFKLIKQVSYQYIKTETV